MNRKYYKYILLMLALAFIGFGIFRGEHIAVFKKATRICLECIGVG